MDNNWIVENLTNAFGVWTSKMTEMWSLLTESPQTCLLYTSDAADD